MIKKKTFDCLFMLEKENVVSGLVKNIIKRKTQKNKYLRLITVYKVLILKTYVIFVIVSSLRTVFLNFESYFVIYSKD